MQSLVLLAATLLASTTQAQIVGTAIVNVFEGTCATQSGADTQVNQVVITPTEANVCDTGFTSGLLLPNNFVVNCARTSTISRVNIFTRASNCVGTPLTTNCVDGNGDATGFYHIFSCSTDAPTQSPTPPTSKAPTLAPSAQPTLAPTAAPTAAPVTSAPVTAAPTQAPGVSKTPTTMPTIPTASSVTKMPTSGLSKAPTSAPTPASFLKCAPQKGLGRNKCENRIKACDNLSISMKWTGTGCSANGVKLNDGGCQCDGYCGFQCKGACNNDSQCVWDDSNKQCLIKATGAVGVPIPFCKP